MKTYTVDLVKLPKGLSGMSEAIVDQETGQAAFVVGEDVEFAKRLVEFMNRMERLKTND